MNLPSARIEGGLRPGKETERQVSTKPHRCACGRWVPVGSVRHDTGEWLCWGVQDAGRG